MGRFTVLGMMEHKERSSLLLYDADSIGQNRLAGMVVDDDGGARGFQASAKRLCAKHGYACKRAALRYYQPPTLRATSFLIVDA